MSNGKPPVFPLARKGEGPVPLRRPASARRITIIETVWPDGPAKPGRMTGTGRDMVTGPDGGAPVIVATGDSAITASMRREILDIAVEPAHPRVQELVGLRAGGASRTALAEIMGDRLGTPLYQLIDDFAGASLVSGWILLQWAPELLTARAKDMAQSNTRRPGLNVCTGFAEGSSALDPANGATSARFDRTVVPPLANPDDPEGWFDAPAINGPYMSRSRWIDVWRESAVIAIEAGFQDSGLAPDGARLAIHEYRLRATMDPETSVLKSLAIDPLILPFAECPGAPAKAMRMIGQPIAGFRQEVIDRLPGTEGCTHLNDVLRALADVPDLARQIPA